MFNKKGESQMFLIIERIEYDSIDHSFNIAQTTDSKPKAEEFKKALEVLNEADKFKINSKLNKQYFSSNFFILFIKNIKHFIFNITRTHIDKYEGCAFLGFIFSIFYCSMMKKISSFVSFQISSVSKVFSN